MKPATIRGIRRKKIFKLTFIYKISGMEGETLSESVCWFLDKTGFYHQSCVLYLSFFLLIDTHAYAMFNVFCGFQEFFY